MGTRTFNRQRLRLARELRQQTQTALARSIEVTPAAISQLESGTARPSDVTVGRLAHALAVPPGFLYGVDREPLAYLPEPFFRSLTRTPTAVRRRARAQAALVALALDALDEAHLGLPRPSFPMDLRIDLADPVETATAMAALLRRRWQTPQGPVGDCVAAIERHGAVCVRLTVDSADVDAFSLITDHRAVVVLTPDKRDRARSRFDASHELGHLILHAPTEAGTRQAEAQAHAFAAEWLMPADQIRSELPKRVDWEELFALKRRWKVSLSALLRRCRDLDTIGQQQYVNGMKYMSARGWRRREPVELGAPEEPSALRTLLTGPQREAVLEALAERDLPLTDLKQVLAATAIKAVGPSALSAR